MAIERKERSLKVVIFYYLPPIVYMALIFYMSSGPATEAIPDIWNIDKVIHFIEYGMLGILWFRALNSRRDKMRKIAIAAFIIAFLYGVSDEIHQYFVPERSSSIYDVVADALGASVGIWSYIKITGGKYVS